MVFDDRKNQAFYDALRNVITPESVVLDLGSGVGLLGLMAAKLGARKTYLVEPAAIAQLSRKLVDANGLGDRVEVIPDKIENARIAEKADVITSVMTGNFLLQEDLLGSLFFARDKCLVHDGVMLPDYGRMMVAPICAPDLHYDRVGCWSEPLFGVDLAVVRHHASNNIHWRRRQMAGDKIEFLAEPQMLKSLDFNSAKEASCNESVSFALSEDGICHGIAGWFDMRLGENWLSGSPKSLPLMHWSSAYLPIDPPRPMKAGDAMDVSIVRPPNGDWSWRVKAEDWSDAHSTLFGRKFSSSKLKPKN